MVMIIKYEFIKRFVYIYIWKYIYFLKILFFLWSILFREKKLIYLVYWCDDRFLKWEWKIVNYLILNNGINVLREIIFNIRCYELLLNIINLLLLILWVIFIFLECY